MLKIGYDKTEVTSPPSRAAWIEMLKIGYDKTEVTRRRLHGRRGLKSFRRYQSITKLSSPPSRAAWIEIMYETVERTLDEVAAFTGGVD